LQQEVWQNSGANWGYQLNDNNRQKGIVQLIDNLNVGGAEQLAIQIANGQAKAGKSAYVYVLRDTGQLVDRINPDVKLRVLNIHRHSITNPFKFLSSLVKGYRKFSKQLKIDNVLVVQSHLTHANFWNLLLSITGLVIGFPTIHNNQEFQYGSSGLKGRLSKIAYKMMVKNCGGVIACSEEVKASLSRELNLSDDSNLVAVTNGVDIPVKISDHDKKQVLCEYNICNGTPVVLGAGRLTYQKNFNVLIDAAKIVKAKLPNVKFIIGGEGELQQDLELQIAEAQLKDTVLLPGNIMNLSEMMQSADLFVLPSKFEGLPLVLLEAMASGLPAVCSRIKGTTDVIEHGKNGLLTDLDDSEGLARAIIHLLDDKKQRSEMSTASVNTIELKFSFNRVLEKLDNIYKGGKS
jgi:glycosyltransferase involved in cell wall biosynthesis